MTKLNKSVKILCCFGSLVFLVVMIASIICIALPVYSQAANYNERPKDAAYIERLSKSEPYKALDYLHQELTKAPNNSYLLFTTASLEMEMEQTKNSAKLFERYFVLNPKCQNATAYIRLASDYQLMGRPDRALSLYNQAITILPNHAKLYCERGCVYATLKQPDKGIVDLNKAIELEPKNVHFLQERGEIYAHKQNYAGAAADFSSIIVMSGSRATPLMYSMRADMYKKMNRGDLAQKDLERVNKFSMDMLDLK